MLPPIGPPRHPDRSHRPSPTAPVLYCHGAVPHVLKGQVGRLRACHALPVGQGVPPDCHSVT
jgi:hypothetical protein